MSEGSVHYCIKTCNQPDKQIPVLYMYNAEFLPVRKEGEFDEKTLGDSGGKFYE